jgi:hypothetical protein
MPDVKILDQWSMAEKTFLININNFSLGVNKMPKFLLFQLPKVEQRP